jgi:hypothetical protein
VVGFTIDEQKFAKIDDVAAVMRDLSNLLTVIHDRGQQVYKSDDLYYIQILNGVELWSLLYDEQHRSLLDEVDRRLLSIVLDRCIGLDAVNWAIPDAEVLLDGERVESKAVLFAITKALHKESIGIIHPKPVERLGPLNASVGTHSTRIFHVGMTLPLEKFYRFTMSFEEVSRQDFRKWTAFAFERLRFALDPSSEINRFKQKYEKIRDDLILHLSAINDEFVSLLDSGKELSEICKQVKAECKIDISPESSQTHGNARAMSHRVVNFEGNKIVCEFHSKLTPMYDRIHFSPTLRKDQMGMLYLVVGPFAEHLPT